MEPQSGDIDFAVRITIIEKMIGNVGLGQPRWIAQVPLPRGDTRHPHPGFAKIANIQVLDLFLIEHTALAGIGKTGVVLSDLPVGLLGGRIFTTSGKCGSRLHQNGQADQGRAK